MDGYVEQRARVRDSETEHWVWSSSVCRIEENLDTAGDERFVMLACVL